MARHFFYISDGNQVGAAADRGTETAYSAPPSDGKQNRFSPVCAPELVSPLTKDGICQYALSGRLKKMSSRVAPQVEIPVPAFVNTLGFFILSQQGTAFKHHRKRRKAMEQKEKL